MRDLVSLILERRWAALALGALLAALGLAAWVSLPIDAFPDVTNVQVMILATAEGLSAEEVEQRITAVIEQQMGGLPKTRQVRSLSRAGLSQVVVVFEDTVDPYFARQVVFERLAGARESLPEGIEPELAPLSTGLGEIFQYTVESDSLNATERRTLQDWLVAPQLRSIPGVTEVNSFGGFARQIHVTVDPRRLLQYGLTLQEVVAAIEGSNFNVGAGFVQRGWEQVYILGRGLIERPEDLGEIVLKAEDGTAVRLREVAEIDFGAATRQGAVTRDGQGETVAGMVIMLRGENARTVVERVKEAAARIEQALPKGAQLDVFYDRTGLIEACIRTVMDALLEGGLLVILVLFLFLAEFRTAVIVVISLPLTFLYSFLLMKGSGLTSNLMSVGGLAFSVGMVVDATIVVVENARRHLAEAGPAADRLAVVGRALREVARPVAFSVLVIALVLVPLLTLQGIEGKMFRPLALTMLFSLLTSIVVALTVVPPLSTLLLSTRPEREFGFVRRFNQGYLRVLESAIARPGRTLGIAVAVLLATAALAPRLGREFIPYLDEGSIAINVVRLPNASLEGSVAVAGEMERRLRRFPEVATVVTKTGRAEISEDPMGPEQSDVFIMLKPRRLWKTGRDKQELIAAIERDLSEIPGLRLAFSQPIALRVNELISGVKSDLAVKVFGPDLERLKEYGDQAAAAMTGVRGATDVRVEQVTGMTDAVIDLDRRAMARYGIRVEDAREVLEAGVAGKTVGTWLDGQQRVPIAVRFPAEERSDLAAIGGLLVAAPGGERVPLSELGKIGLREGPAQVSREKGMRRVVVEANVRGRDLGGFVEDVRERLASLERSLPPGYFIEYGGQFENQERAMRQLALVVPTVLLLVLFLLYSALGSMRDAGLVLTNLPFALAGGVAAAVAFGMHLSVSAAVAFIVLLGVAVQNGVVLLAFFRQLRARGLDVEATAIEGCRLRFRPLFMTALTSFIGHLPMLFATGSGADIQKPLAVVVMGGIVTSTLLTLLVLPAVWVRVERRRP